MGPMTYPDPRVEKQPGNSYRLLPMKQRELKALISSEMNSVARQAWRLLIGPSQSGIIDSVS